MPSATPPITELLRRWNKTGDQDAATDLYNHYQRLALKIAAERLSEQLASRTSPESVAATALRHALSNVAESETYVGDRNDFLRQLRAIIRRRAVDKSRHHTADKRDVRKDRSIDTKLPSDSSEMRPDEELIVAEMAERRVQILMEEPNVSKREVTLIAVLGGFTASKVRTILEPSYGEKLPSRRSIEQWVRNAKLRIREEFDDDLDETDAAD